MSTARSTVGLERVERHAGFQLPQIVDGKPPQVLVEIDDADRVDRVDFKAAVERHDAGPRD